MLCYFSVARKCKPLYIIAAPNSPLAAINVSPNRLLLEPVGERFQISATGQLTNGVQVDLTSNDTGTSYSVQSGTSGVVTVSPKGMVEARGPGQDNILIANSGKTTTVLVTVRADKPIPNITSVNPNLVYLGGAAFTLTVNGLNFLSDSTVYWNGAPRLTTFVSSTQLTAEIPAPDIAAAGTASVTVFNPTPGGGSAISSVTVTAISASVSAASYSSSALAPESIVAAFGSSLATSTLSASSTPLPTSLAGTIVKVKDSTGTERLAPLFFVSPTQINYQIPMGTMTGTATVEITSGNGTLSIGTVQIVAVAPGLFTANASGTGLAAANLLRVKADSSQSYEPVAQFDPVQNKIVAVPIDLGPETDQVFLILYGTGIRFRSNLSATTAKIGGANAEVLFAGPQGGFVGLDQLNVRVPRSLIGRGEVDVTLMVDGKPANTVRVNIR